MTIHILRASFFLLGILTTTLTVNSQDILQVVEKKVEKRLKVNTSDVIKIAADKAEIRINGWEKQEVKLLMKFTVSHQNRDVAKREMEYVKYAIFNETSQIEVRNMFVIPSDVSGITSIITIEYELWIPFTSPVEISNKYGDISLVNLDSKLKLKLELGNLFLDKIRGDAIATVLYGDIIGVGLAGKWNLIASKANITVQDAEGDFYIHANDGKISLATNRHLRNFNVDAVRTEVSLSVPDLSAYNWNLSTSYASIVTFDSELTQSIKKGGGGRTILKTPVTKSLPQVKISTSYNSIIIIKKTN